MRARERDSGVRRLVTRIVRGRKVDEEMERQRRVWLMCFVLASHGEMKRLSKARIVRRGKKMAERRRRERFWRLGWEWRVVVGGILIVVVETENGQRNML